jgi:hypothetical protein
MADLEHLLTLAREIGQVHAPDARSAHLAVVIEEASRVAQARRKTPGGLVSRLRVGALDQQCSQVVVAAFRDLAEADLAGVGDLAGHEFQPGAELVAQSELP